MRDILDRRISFRRKRGSALSEAGPALFLLLFFAILPAIDLIALALSYYSCSTLNDLQSREAAKCTRTEANNPNGAVILTIPNSWRASSLGQIARAVDHPQTEIAYTPGTTNIYVTVSTTVSVQPLLTVPFFAKVPGLGAPVMFRITRSRLLESPLRILE